jgi:hypothetical protein
MFTTAANNFSSSGIGALEFSPNTHSSFDDLLLNSRWTYISPSSH